MPNFTTTQDAKQRLKTIRPYINFDYDLRKKLTKSQKRKIATYYKEITALVSRPYQVFRPRGKKAGRQLQAFAQHDRYLPGLKVAFLPSNGKDHIKLRKNKQGRIVAKTAHVTITDVELDIHELLIDAEKHVNEKITGNTAKQFTIQAGRYEIPHAYLPQNVAVAVAQLCNQYNNTNASNYFGNWLQGLKAYTFNNQAQLSEYLHEKSAAIKAGKKQRKKKKSRIKRLLDRLYFVIDPVRRATVVQQLRDLGYSGALK